MVSGLFHGALLILGLQPPEQGPPRPGPSWAMGCHFTAAAGTLGAPDGSVHLGPRQFWPRSNTGDLDPAPALLPLCAALASPLHLWTPDSPFAKQHERWAPSPQSGSRPAPPMSSPAPGRGWLLCRTPQAPPSLSLLFAGKFIEGPWRWLISQNSHPPHTVGALSVRP